MIASNGATRERIVVAEDREEASGEIVRILTPHWEVEVIPDRKTAFERIVQNPPDIVIAETGIPIVDGFDLLRELRGDHRTAQVPIIGLTPRTVDEEEVEGPMLEADDYVSQPVSPRELIARVKAQLELIRLRRSYTRSENQLRLITDAMPAMISYVDARHRYVFNNKAYEVWFGRKGEDIRGRHVREVLGEEVYDHVRPHLESALSGHRQKFENELPGGADGVRYVEATYVPDTGSDGNTTGVFVLVIDATERKKAERALRESEERFRNMADHAPVMIWMTEPDGSCSYIGQTWYEFTGQSPSEALGFGWLRALHPEDVDHIRDGFLAANERREPCRFEHRLRRKDGMYRWVLVTEVPRFGPGSEFLGYIGSAIDITDLKHIEEDIRDRVRVRTAELEATNKELESFSYTVAHDLRSPLRAMHGLADLVMQDAQNRLEPEQMEYLRRIARESARMDALVCDLLSYSRLGRLELPVRAVGLASVLQSVLLERESEIRECRARIRVESHYPRVLGHEATLSQVITNLISNAIKFVTPGVVPEVNITSVSSSGRVRLLVEDNGIGIAPEHLTRIYGVFERLNNSESYPGTGIGLAIVKRGIERMGGSVGVESLPGRGSTFWIELPEATGPADGPSQSAAIGI